MKSIFYLFMASILITISSCATFSPPINGMYDKQIVKNTNTEKVNVLFIFKHFEQTKGIDAVPKLKRAPHNFDDIFKNALSEISNIKNSNSETINPNNVNNIDKIKNIDRQKKENDYTIEIDFKKEKSFAKFFFGIIVSSLSATIMPIRYKYNYSAEIKVFNNKHQLIKTYQRDGQLNKWVQTFMVFFYPFHHEKRKKEEFYVECMHNVFQQIESEKTIDYNKLSRVTRTIYTIAEISKIIEKYKPLEEINWNNNNLNSWVEKKDIAIIVHFPNDGLSKRMATEAFKMDINNLDKKTNEEGIIFWIDKEEKNPTLLISARNETVLKSQLENNNYLKIILNGMFHLEK